MKNENALEAIPFTVAAVLTIPVHFVEGSVGRRFSSPPFDVTYPLGSVAQTVFLLS